MTIRVAIGGGTGKLGSLVCQKVASAEDMELVSVVVSDEGGHMGTDVCGVTAVGASSLNDALKGVDVYVDLTSPSAASKVIASVPETGANIVLGTTAVDPDSIAQMTANVERCCTSAVISANFAIGVNVFWRMCELMAQHLPDYDIEVIEAHHSQKRDAPSGTAMETVRRLQSSSGINDVVYGRQGVTGPRGREICVHSIRAGDIVGDHTVIFAKNMERVELTHKAISREAFADGCVETIRWVAGRHDGRVHGMSEVLGL